MNDFDSLSSDNLAAMADGLDASASLKEDAARLQAQTARDMHSVASIAREMHAALTANTEAMRDMQRGVTDAALKAEDASNLVFERVEQRAVKTLSDVDRAAKLAMRNSETSASAAVEEMERARKAMLATTVAVSLSCAAALLIMFLVAVGSMWAQFQAGAAWLAGYGWIAIPVSMGLCMAAGYAIATKIMDR